MLLLEASFYQTVVRGLLVVSDGPHVVSEEKS
jgi:hypothetical protein